MDTRRFSPLLLIGDIASFLLFAVVGLSSHEKDYSPAAFARVVLPFLIPWLAAAYFTGLFNRPVSSEPASIVKPVMTAWLPAWAVGLALRSLVWGRDFAPAFAIVTLV
ncbi:MAG: DUF3054 domain-containing protein, partial [Dehalococcoidia bacterium]